MLNRILIFLALASLAAVAFVTLSPSGLRPVVAPMRFEHSGAYAVVGLLFGLAYPRRPVFVWTVVLGAAVCLEALQLLTPERHAHLLHLAVKLFGAVVGITLARFSERALVAIGARIN